MSRLQAYAQLVRIPNVFTVLADVAMGGLLAGGVQADWPVLTLLLLASASLYSAGMVLNDVFDYQLDCQERPERPLPSGQISLPAARRLGWSLLAAGLGLALVAATLRQPFATSSVIAAGALAATIVAYDAWLKSTGFGPVAMGTCRALNVLLGASLAADGWMPLHYRVALGMGVYIAGVTLFARTEAEVSNRAMLAVATTILLAGIGIICTATQNEHFATAQHGALWPWLWVAMIFPVAARAIRAIMDPTPEAVQRAVKHAILSIIVIDAAAAFSTAGAAAAFVLLLLIPAMFLGRWIYST